MDFLQHIFGFNSDSPLLFTQFYFWAFFAIVYTIFALIMELRPNAKRPLSDTRYPLPDSRPAASPTPRWVTHADFGYEHNPAMPLEKDGTLWVSTKNGLLLGMDAQTGKVLFRHKIGNSILNTPLPLSGTECIFTSSEGTITYIKAKR